MSPDDPLPPHDDPYCDDYLRAHGLKPELVRRARILYRSEDPRDRRFWSERDTNPAHVTDVVLISQFLSEHLVEKGCHACYTRKSYTPCLCTPGRCAMCYPAGAAWSTEPYL